MERTLIPQPVDVRHVIVPLDGSALASAALPTARALAARFGAALSTISVARDERELEALRLHAKEAIGANAAPTRIDVVVGTDPSEAIAQHAKALEGAVIVMSTHARGRVAGSFLGSVTRTLLASSSAPLLAVGPVADRPGRLVGRPRRRPDDWPEPLSEGDVVVLVDGTPTSEAAIPIAAQWAVTLGTELVVMTIAEDAPAGLDGVRSSRFGPHNPEAYVESHASQWREAGMAARGVVAYDPIGVASGVNRYLAENSTALVVLTPSARTGFARLRHGATAAAIARTSSVPTLLVSANQEHARPRRDEGVAA